MLPVVHVYPVPQRPLIQAPTADDPSKQRGVDELDVQQSPLVHVNPVPHCPLTHAPAACVPSAHTVAAGQQIFA